MDILEFNLTRYAKRDSLFNLIYKFTFNVYMYMYISLSNIHINRLSIKIIIIGTLKL